MSRPLLLSTALLLVSFVGPLLAAEPELVLPNPTGSFAVGRITVVAVDVSRGRPISMFVWYPSPGGKERAEYFPDATILLRDSEGGRQLGEIFGHSLALVTSTHTRSNSWLDAPVSSGGPFPLLMFLPGLGLPVLVYTAQMEDLASRGFVVAAVSPPGDAGPGVVNGKAVHFDEELWARHPPVYGSSGFYAERAQQWAKDLTFALDTLIGLSNDRKSLLASSIDRARIGAFGHSQGGRSAAAACMLDRRFRACLNEDGRYDEDDLLRPYWPIQGRRFHGSFTMLDWFDPGLTAEDFAAMHTNLATYANNHLHPLPSAQAAYSAVEDGAFRMTILEPGMAHTAFTDLPYLLASTPSKRAEADHQMAIIETTVAAFFDWKLGKGKALTTRCGSIEGAVLLQCFSPKKPH